MSGKRLNFLDWLRVVLVVFVVYAHLIFCGAQLGRPNDEGTVDDHEYNMKNPNHLAVRWIAVARQWCIPLLFWISGASSAMSFGLPGKLLKMLSKLVIISALGCFGNAMMWILGPRDENCSFRNPCQGKGIMFDFTEDPYSGNIEPYFNQMWYTVALFLLLLLNYPLFNAMCSRSGSRGVCLLGQWIGTVLLYALITVGAIDDCPNPLLLISWLSASEAILLALPLPCCRPPWLPLRAMQYTWAVVAVFQLSVSPITKTPVVDDISGGYILYLLIATNRWFEIGFLMVRPRAPESISSDVVPCLSQAWPVGVFLMVLCCPSTNWAMEGVLPYPFLPKMLDRFLYVGGTFVTIFVVDRSSRGFECRALPCVLSTASIILYMGQVVFVTLSLRILQPLVQHDLGSQPREDGELSVVVILSISVLMSVLLAAAPVVWNSVRSNTAQRRHGDRSSEMRLA